MPSLACSSRSAAVRVSRVTLDLLKTVFSRTAQAVDVAWIDEAHARTGAAGRQCSGAGPLAHRVRRNAKVSRDIADSEKKIRHRSPPGVWVWNLDNSADTTSASDK